MHLPVIHICRRGDYWRLARTDQRWTDQAHDSRQEYETVGVEVTLDITKAKRELGYRPVITRVAGLETVHEAG